VKALREVKPLQEGATGTFDHPETEDVPLWVVVATLPFLAPVVAVMVMIQWLTGCRPNEISNPCSYRIFLVFSLILFALRS